MKACLRTGVLFLAVWLGFSGVSFAKQVFLRDGSVLDCESFWRRNGQVVVKVNRDIILEFAPEEVNLRKTFQPVHRVPPHKPKKSAATPSPSRVVAAAGVADLAGSPTARPEQAKLVAVSAPVPAPTRAVAEAAQPQSQPAQAAPAAAAKKAAQSEPAPAASPDPGPTLSKAEVERRTRENAALMAEGVRKQDPERMKKAAEAQRNLVQEQKGAKHGAEKTGMKAGGLRPEPVWFKYLLILLVSSLLIVIGMWGLFVKAGHSGLKSLIPIYNMYVLMQISGKPGWWCFLLLIPFLGAAFQLLAMVSLAEKFGRSAIYGVGLLIFPMCFYPMLAFGGAQYGEGVPEELEFTFSEEPPPA